MTARQKQTGVALVTAILLVAIATILATKLAWDNTVSMRRTETLLTREQARMFGMGAEGVAINVLSEDDPAFDHAGENWAIVLPPMEIGIDEVVMGTMQGRLHDAQGRFNLNNLVPVQGAQPDANAKRQFESLVDTLQLDTGIVDAVIDWIDEDTIPQGRGAEDGSYTALDPPYRAANNYLLSVSELRAISNIDEESYQALLPHVTALPPGWCGSNGGITPVNINSASAAVIESLHADITAGDAEAWVEERGETGWEAWSEISNWPSSMVALHDSEVTLKSDCFGLDVIVNVGSSVLSMYSLLDRSQSSDLIVTRMRTFGLE